MVKDGHARLDGGLHFQDIREVPVEWRIREKTIVANEASDLTRIMIGLTIAGISPNDNPYFLMSVVSMVPALIPEVSPAVDLSINTVF